MNSTYRCPDCGREFENPRTLTDHALTDHVSAETPAAHLRKPKHPGLSKGIGVIAILLGVGFWVLAALGGGGVFDRESAPLEQGSVVHRLAVDLQSRGAIDEFRAVEPSADWDTEYELDDGDGYLRIRGEGTGSEGLEYEAFPGDLRDDMEDAIRKRGFDIEE